VVSRGGTTSGEGAKTAVTAAAAPSAPPAPVLASAGDLSERPHLLVDDPCRGFFPVSANADSATAVVRVVIEANGKVRAVTLVEETPAGQGFGIAARQCMRAQRFSAPLDHDGRAVATATTIRVHFER
jgi:TonB family protein